MTKLLKIGVEALDWAHREDLVSQVMVEKALKKIDGFSIRIRDAKEGNKIKRHSKAVCDG
ncbi:Hypothetical predicted protein, partial [Olea europaea subsp. europaea]